MNKHRLTTTHIIMLGFLAGALIGMCLLMLPLSHQKGIDLNPVDALFVAVSSICVTGLSTVNIGQTFSFFGQAVLLIMIQFGGLGIVTFTTLVLLTFHHRINLSERMLMQNAYNLDTLSGLVRLTKRIFRVTLMLEAIGAVGYSFVFIPRYGLRGIWFSIFHAVSAFCNAGIDLLGGNSFSEYVTDPILNVTTIYLIIVSGLGFPVYWEILRLIRRPAKSDHALARKKMNLQTRLVLSLTAGFVIVGMLLTLILEYNNPQTLGLLTWPQKCMASLFQSVTLRTAGFVTIDQGYFRNASCLLYMIFMFIGGSPAGTAGGIKTVTIAVLVASMIANIRGRSDVTMFRRRIADDYVRRCVAIVSFSFLSVMILTLMLLAVEQSDFLDTMYEMISAIATVGLSRGLTGSLSPLGKLIVSLTMYLGRIGPITLALAFNSRNASGSAAYADSRIIIG